MKALVTGSSGLIGSAVVTHLDQRGWAVVGLDSNARADFFGDEADTTPNRLRLERATRGFRHLSLDVRDRAGLARLIREEGPFELVVHSAAQPSHDLAARRPFDDYDTNATGTLNLLEAVRHHSPEAVFVHMSTNKVYGDAPNELPLVERPTRWDFVRPEDAHGVSESLRIDSSKHSLFGASKVAADVMVQEYGRTFGLRTTCLRCGCMTGPDHAGVELHGFLSYLVKAHLTGRTYTVFGYKGKQVRDNLHAHDVATAIEAIYRDPRAGAVYNLGGGRENACSILEAFERLQELTGRPVRWVYDPKARSGDHICYYSDLRRFQRDYPDWRLERSLDATFVELVRAWTDRLALRRAG